MLLPQVSVVCKNHMSGPCGDAWMRHSPGVDYSFLVDEMIMLSCLAILGVACGRGGHRHHTLPAPTHSVKGRGRAAARAPPSPTRSVIGWAEARTPPFPTRSVKGRAVADAARRCGRGTARGTWRHVRSWRAPARSRGTTRPPRRRHPPLRRTRTARTRARTRIPPPAPPATCTQQTRISRCMIITFQGAVVDLQLILSNMGR